MSDNGTVPTDKMKWALDSAISLSIARGMPGVAEGLTCAKVQLQQLREELEQARASAKHWQDRYDRDAERLPASLVELEQVKKERDGWRGEAKRERELVAEIRAERDEAVSEVHRLTSETATTDVEKRR